VLAAPEAAPQASTPTRAAAAAEAAPRKLKRSEVRAIRASAPKQPRKNPLSVLATMTIVGGMFAVAGLPAYALNGPDATVAEKDVPAQSVAVSAEAATTAPVRDGFRATTPDQLAQIAKDALRANLNAEYLASGARELGDDYPWPYELRDYQGGGLSPLNYYYRECVDFVAWRLNRDAGSYQAPFKWVWSNLTPTGGNGSQWLYAWEAHGWPVSSVPIVGSVAYTGYNHVAYVKAVNSDGTVLIEEYNYGGDGKYDQRTIPASSVPHFLYPPPA
jgi:peptidoglycan DL-endopeptidase CwlO